MTPDNDSTVCEIPLTRGKVALVDREDYDRVAVHKWHAIKAKCTWYAERGIKIDGRNSTIGLHRELMNAQPGELIDHIDGDGLNCRRSNMRRTDYQGNARNRRMNRTNRHGFKGVRPTAASGRWTAEITIGGKSHHLGTYDTAEEAARAYDARAAIAHGQYARLNFPEHHTGTPLQLEH